MGSWNATHFGNDTALDWLSDLEGQANGRAFLAATLTRAESSECADAPEAEEALAAAAVIGAAATEPVGTIVADAKRWIITSGFSPDAALLDSAIQAVVQVRNTSELRDLWEESGDVKIWLRQVDGLIERLRRVRAAESPSRSPKAAGIPRSLHKLAALHARQPDPNLRKKIHAKVAALRDPNAATADTDYLSPLTLMARHGLLEETLELLARGADPNFSASKPFIDACSAGHIDVAKALHSAGAIVFHEHRTLPESGCAVQVAIKNPDEPTHGHRYCLALFSVARTGPSEMVDYLTTLGANIAQTDLNGETLLHKAAESGCVAMLDYLIDAGLDPSKAKGESGDTPLHYAARAGQIDAVRKLLERGADPNAVSRFDGEVHRWQEAPLDIAELPEVRALLVANGARSA